MASNEESWIYDIINDFIHSSIWLSPIQIFIDTNCACFDYDDDDDHQLSLSSLNEQKKIYKQYQNLVDSLLISLSEDLKLDVNQVKNYYQKNNSITIDESYEQLYSINDFNLFTEMMKRKNLILQLQALVNLQLECGLLKQTDTNDDQVLQLLLKATSSSFTSKMSMENSTTVSSNVTRNDRIKMNSDKHQQFQTKKAKSNIESKTIDSISEEILREKLKELTIDTTSSVDDEIPSVMLSRQNFLKQQRDLIIRQRRNQCVRELEKESIHVRPQSAANVARKSMETTIKQEQQISNDELEKRRAIAAKLRREVVDKR